MKDFAMEHYIITFLLAETAMSLSFRLVNRVLRTIKVYKHGWPTALNMDADGDIILPKKED